MSRPNEVIAERYRLVRRIAAGGMGSVWEAWDERLHRRVALKELHPQPGRSAEETRLAGARAMREARLTARLHHANAVPVYDVVDHDGQPCLIMQYLPSRSLQSVLSERGPMDVPEAARIGREIAGALAAAHQAGIVHRDVKPGNVLIDESGTAKLTDFGISHALDDVNLTSTGMVTGTPAFLAPEVARGAPSSFASDVFSLGATLFTALEGAPPFGSGDNPMATLHRVASGEPDPARRSGALTGALRGMLSTNPADRPSMDEVSTALDAVSRQAGRPDADGPTERLRQTPNVPPPPSTTMTLPAAPPRRPPQPVSRTTDTPPPVRARPAVAPPPPRSDRSRAALGLLVLLAVAALVVLLVVNLTGNDPGTGTAIGTRSGSSAASNSPASRVSTPSSTPSSTPPSGRAPASNPAPASKTRPKTKTESKSKSAKPTKPGNNGAPTAAELTQAVSDYYALLPGDTGTAWGRLTASFQQNKAQGRSAYDSFWADFSGVSAENLSADASAATVTGSITYTRQDGTSSTENTTFSLVREGGVLKIDGQG